MVNLSFKWYIHYSFVTIVILPSNPDCLKVYTADKAAGPPPIITTGLLLFAFFAILALEFVFNSFLAILILILPFAYSIL